MQPGVARELWVRLADQLGGDWVFSATWIAGSSGNCAAS